jgi:streptomycin 6-kinase
MIPPLLTRNVTEVWPADGADWLARLPALVDDIVAEWGLTLGQRYPMTFHWVASVTTAAGAPAVLKLGVPDGHLHAEAEALRIFDGDGAVRLLAEDRDRGALLEERAAPGTTLSRLVPADDETATDVLLAAGRRLHRVPPPDCALPHLRAYRDGFRSPGTVDPKLVDRAAELFDDLCASSPGDVVLHGDLHHDNVLRDDADGWTAIDPHGLVGDPGFEIGALLYNPDPADRDPALLRLVPARLDRLGGSDRTVAWGFVMAVLSCVWDGHAGSRAGDVATLLLPRLA